MILSFQSGPQLVPVCLGSLAASLQKTTKQRVCFKEKSSEKKTHKKPSTFPSLLHTPFVIGFPDVCQHLIFRISKRYQGLGHDSGTGDIGAFTVQLLSGVIPFSLSARLTAPVVPRLGMFCGSCTAFFPWQECQGWAQEFGSLPLRSYPWTGAYGLLAIDASLMDSWQ